MVKQKRDKNKNILKQEFEQSTQILQKENTTIEVEIMESLNQIYKSTSNQRSENSLKN